MMEKMKMNKRWMAALMLLVMMLALTACGEKKEAAPKPTDAPQYAGHPIVGVWVLDRDQMMQGVSQEEYEQNKEAYDSSEVAMEFTADGKLLMHISAMGQTDIREVTYTVSDNQLAFMGTAGTFAIEGDRLTLVQGSDTILYTRKK